MCPKEGIFYLIKHGLYAKRFLVKLLKFSFFLYSRYHLLDRVLQNLIFIYQLNDGT